mmetsp:Transcript_13373/g.27609  ORF Transcript_13373/g.27609 Transcript_13373/m.27609 type:complete len:268 (-) Transcript_13373:24-827(-)
MRPQEFGDDVRDPGLPARGRHDVFGSGGEEVRQGFEGGGAGQGPGGATGDTGLELGEDHVLRAASGRRDVGHDGLGERRRRGGGGGRQGRRFDRQLLRRGVRRGQDGRVGPGGDGGTPAGRYGLRGARAARRERRRRTDCEVPQGRFGLGRRRRRHGGGRSGRGHGVGVGVGILQEEKVRGKEEHQRQGGEEIGHLQRRRGRGGGLRLRRPVRAPPSPPPKPPYLDAAEHGKTGRGRRTVLGCDWKTPVEPAQRRSVTARLSLVVPA